MQVKLAGYNIDKNLIDKLGDNISATPEVISAAYARISRSSKSVTELRSAACKDVVKARNSNWEIVFGMGHASVAEHAVFNIDIIGISRYLAEFIQKSRLASFTEKSQRYVTLDGDYVLPAEIAQSKFKDGFVQLMEKSFQLYSTLYGELKLQKAAEQKWSSKRDLEGAAKEDARYVLPLCTKTQMGMTINARSFEQLLRRLAAIPLAEAEELFRLLYNEVSSIAPSIIRFIEADDFTSRTLNWKQKTRTKKVNFNQVNLINSPQFPDDTILAGMLFEQSGGAFKDAIVQVGKLNKEQKKDLWDAFFTGIKSWHKVPRVFELVSFMFELTMSASCYAQFKRHRTCTIIKAPYNVSDGFVIPHSIKDVRQIKLYFDLIKQFEYMAEQVKSVHPALYPYALTNAHRVRILVKMSLRELYHFIRLRSDEHAQWEILELSNDMRDIVKKHCPQSARWLMGKSEMN